MFFDSKFSILKAYLTSLKINIEYIAFYLVWELIVWLIGFVVMIYLAISMDIIDPVTLKNNYSWIFHYASKLFTDISIQKAQVFATNATGHEPYDIFKLILPENILNHTLEDISWSEYFKVILMPKKVMLFISVFFISIMAMTISVGYIKTALKFQSGQKASLHDLYQYFYLVPQYFLSKVIIFGLCLLPVIPFLGRAKFLGALKLNIAISICVAVFLYQRLRFIQYFIIDKGMSIVTAVKASWKLTQGSVFHLSVYSIVATLLFTHPGSGFLIILFMLIYKQADVNVYKQMIE